jgi:hypothetical protein
LAHWLRDHGHQVVAPTAGATGVADAIINALRTGPAVRDVLAVLPTVDGREQADRWLLT